MVELLYFLVFLWVSFSIGRRLLKLFRLKINFIEEIVFGIALGYFLFGYAAFFLGVFGLIYKPIFYAIFLLGIFISLFDIKYIMQNTKKMFSNLNFGLNLESILIAILFFLIIINLIVSMAPEWEFDATSYHLIVPKLYIKAHSIIYRPDIIESNMPFFMGMLYLIGMILKNGILSKLIGFSLGVMLAFAIVSFSKRYFDIKVGLLAAIILFLMPIFMEHLVRAESDIPVAFFSFLAFYAFVVWFFRLNIRWLLLSAIFTGLSLSTKYSAGAVFLILSLFLLIRLVTLKQKENSYKFIALSLFFFIPLLILSPWLLKNYVYTGNPIFPFLYNIFGGKYLSQTVVHTLVNAGNSFGVNVTNYLLLPWHLTMSVSKFPSIMGIGPIFLAFIPLLFLINPKKKVVLSLLLVSSFFAITTWFFVGAHYVRFVLLAFPQLSIVAAFVICKLASYNSGIFRVVIFATLLSTLVFGLNLWAGMNMKHFPVIFGFETKEQFYGKLKDYNLYDASTFINTNTSPESKVLLVKDSRGYFIDRDYVRYNILYTTYFEKFDNEKALTKRLEELNITHILINHNFDNSPRVKLLHAGTDNLLTNLTIKYSEKIYDKRGIEVFELK